MKKLDRLKELIVPTTDEEVRARMRAYEAEATPGFVPAENEILCQDVKDHLRPFTQEELLALSATHSRPGEESVGLEDVGLGEAGAGLPRPNPTTVAAIRAANAGKVTPVNLDDL